jgi:hypothetical protein
MNDEFKPMDMKTERSIGLDGMAAEFEDEFERAPEREATFSVLLRGESRELRWRGPRRSGL